MSNDFTPDDDLYSRWESILADADIQSVPIHLLRQITIGMSDGTSEVFDIQALLDKGLTMKEVEFLVEEFVKAYDDEIETYDFHLNIQALADEVESNTKRLLG